MTDDWRETIDFYVELIEKHHWKLQPMLEFVRWLAESEHSWMHPSTSHASLGLSPVIDYGDRLSRPMIYLAYGAGRWELMFQEGQGNTVKSEPIGDPRGEMARIAEWLRRHAIFAR